MGILASGNQTFAEAFAKHERDPKVKIEDLQAWKAALKEVGNIYLDGMYNNTGNTSHLS